MKKAVLYMRVSTKEKANQNNLLVGQKKQLEKYCSDNGIQIIGEYSDFIFNEGKRINYEGLNIALRLFFDGAFAKKPIDYLVIVTPNIIQETEAILLRAELGFYSSELLIINEK